MAHKKENPRGRSSTDELMRFVGDRMEFLDNIHDMVCLEVDKRLKEIIGRKKPPDSQDCDRAPPKSKKQEH